MGAGGRRTSRGGPLRLRPLRSVGSSRESRRISAGGGTASGVARAAICGGGVTSGVGRAAICGGGVVSGVGRVRPWNDGLGGADSSWVERGTREAPDPSGRPIRSPRDSRSLEPRLAGGAGRACGSGRGTGWGTASGGLGGAAAGGGSTSRIRSGLSRDTGGLATSNSRPKRPEWTTRETATDLLRTDWRIVPRCFVFVRPIRHIASRLYGRIGQTTSACPRRGAAIGGTGRSGEP